MPKVFDNVQFGFAACRIGMRKCWQWLSCYRPVIIIRDQYQILCIGLEGSGKTTALATLVGESVNDIEPTTGFNIKTLPLKDTVVDIKELGGSEVIRPFWSKYFEGQHGILYVINAAASEEMLKQSSKILQETLQNSSLKGLPCVILATHQDVEGSKSHQEILHLFQGVLHGRKWQVHMCGFQDRDGVQSSLENLVDLMTGIS
ncbi:ADP-ribosylation factor-like protein 15 [Parasteatoda tepidariorum]|uniref:ADP-ribosylation factor-like protein 15 n=1 Tax=Parasteatoda tepidariorum TaxID=114398 RepID=UPI00077FBAE0|nr:ADP-ribosylation factor-like protein 15 [Parasteatoda tepidariorum]